MRIGGKRARTLAFGDDAIRVRAHKKTPLGTADIVVQNKIGAGSLPNAVEVTGPGD